MQNELILADGKVGFMEAEPEPKTFLSVESIEKVYMKEPSGDDIELSDYPLYHTLFELSTTKKVYERQAYNILELFGDFGGFNDAMITLVGLVSSFYSA